MICSLDNINTESHYLYVMLDISRYFARTGVDPYSEAFPEMPVGKPTGSGKMTMRSEERTEHKPLLFSDFASNAYEANPERELCLYLHTPFCYHRCSFCPFYVNKTYTGFSQEYTSLLSDEINVTVKPLTRALHKRAITAVYFGGGTPSDLDIPNLSKIICQIHSTFPTTQETEFTIEGRIRGHSAEKAKAWVAAGANRFSLGVQSTNTKLRRKLGRLADREEIKSVLNGLCTSGAVVVVDIIYGFPDQNLQMVLDDIHFLAQETSIHGLDLYELQQVSGSPLTRAIEEGRSQPAATRAERGRIYAAAAELLDHYGFEHFTRQHWRRDQKERSLYNRTAKTEADILPFGSGAGGRLGHYGLSISRNLEDYTQRVLRGEKPLGMVMPVFKPEGTGFLEQLGQAIELRKLPPLNRWPEQFRSDAKILLSQWAEAGLLRICSDGTDISLTSAGTFWALQLQRKLIDFITADPMQSVYGNR